MYPNPIIAYVAFEGPGDADAARAALDRLGLAPAWPSYDGPMAVALRRDGGLLFFYRTAFAPPAHRDTPVFAATDPDLEAKLLLLLL